MANKLIQYFLQISALSSQEIALIEESMDIHLHEKGDFLLKEGQTPKDTYFVLSGCVRAFQTLEGEEVTKRFFTESQWILSLNDFSSQMPATTNLVCIETTEVVVGNEQKAQALFQAFPRFETLSRAVMEKAFAEEYLRLQTYLTSKPEERYLQLLHTQPDLLQKVPQYQLASYLGVKPESLSRIRKRLANQQKNVLTHDYFCF